MEIAGRRGGMSPKLKQQLVKITGMASFMLACVYGPHMAWRLLPSAAIESAPEVSFGRGPTVRIKLHEAARAPSQVERDVMDACVPERKAGPRPDDGGAGSISLSFKEATSFLACATSVYEQRLCDPAQRRLLAANLAGYATVWRVVVDLIGKLDPNGISDLAGRMNGGSSADITAGRRAITAIDRDVAAGIWKLSESGYLSAADFGRSVPPDIAAYLQQAKVRSCR